MPFPARSTYPASNLGYWRGTGIQGMGPEGVKDMGTATQGVGMASQGTVNVAGSSWHPTVLYLLGLVIAECIVFGVIGRILK
jgi:hypothetical protein